MAEREWNGGWQVGQKMGEDREVMEWGMVERTWYAHQSGKLPAGSLQVCLGLSKQGFLHHMEGTHTWDRQLSLSDITLQVTNCSMPECVGVCIWMQVFVCKMCVYGEKIVCTCMCECWKLSSVTRQKNLHTQHNTVNVLS